MKNCRKILFCLVLLIGAVFFGYLAAPAWADPLTSTNYRFVETALGGTGGYDSQSANFRADGSGAILGIGNSLGTGFQINAGNLTTPDPALSFAITSGSVNFGNFSAATTATSTATFEVINYTSFGYVVQILGTPPKYGSHTISAMTSTGSSQTGIEQYGINLVANTSPSSFGANPDQGEFGYGVAATNYNTPNNYRFVSGETIASAPKSSGKTIYTISYIVNVSSLTPGGQYTGSQTIICTGTY